jgi:crotonobetainyl-CoA:carnitine CoA-transferase CaiB-like acyl-CoA transferase
MIIAVGNDAQWKSCARVLGLAELFEDDAIATNAGRLAHRDHVVAAVADRVRTRHASELIDELSRGGVPCGIVKTVLEALDETVASPLTGIAPSVPGNVRLRPPMLNEHEVEIRSKEWNAFE